MPKRNNSKRMRSSSKRMRGNSKRMRRGGFSFDDLSFDKLKTGASSWWSPTPATSNSTGSSVTQDYTQQPPATSNSTGSPATDYTQQPPATDYTQPPATQDYIQPSATQDYTKGYGGKRRRSHVKRGGTAVPNMSLNNLASTASPVSNVQTVKAQTYVGGRTKKRRRHRHSKSCRHNKKR